MIATLLSLALQGPAALAAERPALPTYPFAVGETLLYSAKLGMLSLGSATLEVAGVDTVRGTETFHLKFQIEGKAVFYELDDRFESWVGTRDFKSRRFHQLYREQKKERERLFEIFPDSGYYRQDGRDSTQPTVADPLDDTAFFYFVRTMPLQVGKTYSSARYFRKDRNPVVVKVLKREKMEMPDGSKVQCLVLHPIIETKGLFSKRSETRIWLTDDERRIPVQIRGKFPFGTVTLKLKEMTIPVAAASR